MNCRRADAAALRALPGVDALAGVPLLADTLATYGRPATVSAVRAEIDACRRALLAGDIDTPPPASALAERAVARLAAHRPATRRVFNLTGVVLHTNLGRAPLAEPAIAALIDAAGAASVEYDLEAGARGERDRAVESALCALTGAEAAIVVNNNAAAVVLMLNALASRKPRREVIVSRGELIEIGGAFRIPDIMARAGARLREVGTTNRTHAADFADAIDDSTALLMRIWPSNYEIAGFTARVAETELAAIAHAHDLPMAVDLGSGSLIALAEHGLPHEPTPQESLAAGADLVCFSADKLLGGPQAGLIVGRAEWIEVLRRSPLKRALRCDKLILAALEATLTLYANPDTLTARVPGLRLLTRRLDAITETATRLCPLLADALSGSGARLDVVATKSQIGSGSLPVDRLPSRAVRIAPPSDDAHPGHWLATLKRHLAGLPIPVIGRIGDNALWLDMRCLEDEAGFVAQLPALQRVYAE